MIIPNHVRALNPHLPKRVRKVRVKEDVTPSVPRLPGLKSELEASLYDQIQQAGLPPPILQATLAKPLGRGYVYDGAWIEERIGYEVNGATFTTGGHSTGTGIGRDYRKWNAAILLGWHLFVFDSKMIQKPKDGGESEAIETLRKAFAWCKTDVMRF